MPNRASNNIAVVVVVVDVVMLHYGASLIVIIRSISIQYAILHCVHVNDIYGGFFSVWNCILLQYIHCRLVISYGWLRCPFYGFKHSNQKVLGLYSATIHFKLNCTTQQQKGVCNKS